MGFLKHGLVRGIIVLSGEVNRRLVPYRERLAGRTIVILKEREKSGNSDIEDCIIVDI